MNTTMFLDVYYKMATMFKNIAYFEDIYFKIQETGLPKITFVVKCKNIKSIKWINTYKFW